MLLQAIFLLVVFIILLPIALRLDLLGYVILAVIMMFFPIHIQLFGRDALTTSSVFIFLVFGVYMTYGYRRRRMILSKFDIIIFFAMISGLLSVFFPFVYKVISFEMLGTAVRGIISYLSAIMIFIVVKNYPVYIYESSNRSLKTREDMENILSLILLLTMTHILISILVYLVPSFGGVFDVFLSRDVEQFQGVANIESDIARIDSFIFGAENYGEIIAFLCPVVVYKISRNNWWLLGLIILFVGEVLSGTRSGIILFVFGLIVSLFYCYRKEVSKIFYIITGLFLFFLINIVGNYNFWDGVFFRFGEFFDSYQRGDSILESLNRGFLPDVWIIVVENLSFFGNAISEFNFHNLYLTVLHQKGIVGAILFFMILLASLFSLIRCFQMDMNRKNSNLSFVLIISIILFFINELKFEFTRGGSYEQIIMVLFSICYGLGKILHEPILNEDLFKDSVFMVKTNSKVVIGGYFGNERS